ncbi:MAG TPA: TonB family protein [Blastocatellia bacterium]|nr:TonB family protein [Blastocatellia bacterium]
MTQRPTLSRTFFTCALLSFAFTVSAFAQSTEWKEYISEKGKFSVMLPGAPDTGYRLGPADFGAVMSYVINYQKDEKAWSVNYFDLRALPPDADAVKKLLEKIRDSYTNRPRNEKLQTLNGYPTLEFMEPKHASGRVRIFRIILVKQRVYELWVVTQANQSVSEDVTKFFHSFNPVPLTDEEFVEAANAAIADKEKAAPRRLTVSSGVLEATAIKKVQPLYPPEAKAAGVSGQVKIQILVSEIGNVIEAKTVEGHPLLRASALDAARMWVFKPTEIEGIPVKVKGILLFKFRLR